MIADFGQRMEKDRKVPSSVNGKQIFNIFKDQPVGSSLGIRACEESNHFKKERTSLSGKPSALARHRNILAGKASGPQVCPGQSGRLNFGDVGFKPLILLHVEDRSVTAVGGWIYFTVAFTDHPAKLQPLSETADAAEKI